MTITRMEYTGKITQLQGETALVRDIDTLSPYHNRLCPKKHVVAQFDSLTIIYNGTPMLYGWHPFLRSDFTPLGAKPVF